MSLDNILNRYGGRARNDLNEVLSNMPNDDPNDPLYHSDILSYPETKYIYIDGLKTYLSNYNNFTVLSINIQCLNAKYNQLLSLIEDISLEGCTLGAICIQETWLDEPDPKEKISPFSFPGYKLIQQGR